MIIFFLLGTGVGVRVGTDVKDGVGLDWTPEVARNIFRPDWVNPE